MSFVAHMNHAAAFQLQHICEKRDKAFRRRAPRVFYCVRQVELLRFGISEKNLTTLSILSDDCLITRIPKMDLSAGHRGRQSTVETR